MLLLTMTETKMLNNGFKGHPPLYVAKCMVRILTPIQLNYALNKIQPGQLIS